MVGHPLTVSCLGGSLYVGAELEVAVVVLLPLCRYLRLDINNNNNNELNILSPITAIDAIGRPGLRTLVRTVSSEGGGEC
jgi:hypothetical protein